MTFQVIEQGRRIETPWQSLFPPHGVTKLQASARIAPIDAQTKSPEPTPAYSFSRRSQADVFEDIEQQPKQPKPASIAEHIMVAPVISLAPDSTLVDAWQLFGEGKFRHIPVIDHTGKLLGLLSDRDLLRATSSLVIPVRSPVDSVASIMHTKVLTATADTNIRELVRVMLEHKVGAMPVVTSHVDSTHQLIGMITRSDILRAITHQVPIELWV